MTAPNRLILSSLIQINRGTVSGGDPLITTTAFPQAIANAASFNVSLLGAIASATSDEVRAKTNEGYKQGLFPFCLYSNLALQQARALARSVIFVGHLL